MGMFEIFIIAIGSVLSVVSQFEKRRYAGGPHVLNEGASKAFFRKGQAAHFIGSLLVLSAIISLVVKHAN